MGDDPPMAGFGIEHLPFGVVAPGGQDPRPAVRLGDDAVDLRALARAGALPEAGDAFEAPVLNPFLALGPAAWAATRERLVALAAAEPPRLPLAEVDQRLPVAVGDYVDFYSSIEHATTVGRLFRPDGDPLPPSWRHLPIGYHGRAGTVVVSGTPVTRPHGQLGPGAFGPEPRLDIELELAFVTGDGPIFGVALLNDWSARAIQRWEYQPLGPFLGKSFCTSLAAWITPLDALRRVPGPEQDPPPLEHLRVPEPRALDVDLEVELRGTVVCRVNARRLYWSMEQQLAHATSNGATVRAGDLFGSGTISGWDPGTQGCLLEATRGGEEPLTLEDGTRRAFLEDGDTVVLRGRSGPVELAEVAGTVG